MLPSETQKSVLKADVLSDLRDKIKKLEGFKAYSPLQSVQFGIPEIDSHLPERCFPLSATHEFMTDCMESKAATIGFIASLLGRINKNNNAIIWITKSGSLYAPGLIKYGLNPNNLVVIQVRRDKEALWAMEEALRCNNLSVAVCEINATDLSSSRRLQLAVENSGMTGFLIRSKIESDISTACVTRWIIQPLPSEERLGLPGVGTTRWQVNLTKVKHGTPGQWVLESEDNLLSLIQEHKSADTTLQNRKQA